MPRPGGDAAARGAGAVAVPREPSQRPAARRAGAERAAPVNSPAFPSAAMRVITLNVNGLRSAARKGFARWLARAEPWDVVCLQEIKCLACDVPRPLVAPRRAQAVFHPAERKGYAGVALY